MKGIWKICCLLSLTLTELAHSESVQIPYSELKYPFSLNYYPSEHPVFASSVCSPHGPRSQVWIRKEEGVFILRVSFQSSGTVPYVPRNSLIFNLTEGTILSEVIQRIYVPETQGTRIVTKSLNNFSLINSLMVSADTPIKVYDLGFIYGVSIAEK